MSCWPSASTAIVAACSREFGELVALGGFRAGLTGKTWHLTAITEKVPAFQGVVPTAEQANYTIEFKSDGTFSAKADCNQLAGTYTTTGTDGLAIVPGPMTMAMCPEGSLSTQYVDVARARPQSYAIANDQLTITLSDEGTLVFG